MASYLRKEIRRTSKILVTVFPIGKTVQMVSGSRLWDALKLTGMVTDNQCGGNSACTICHVRILEGAQELSKMNKAEQLHIQTISGGESRSRLACKAILGSRKVIMEVVNS